MKLTEQEKKQLLEISRLTLEEYVKNGKKPEIDKKNLHENLLKNAGAFVTLKKNENLRGCIGRFIFTQPLYSVVIDMTIAAASEDPRFSPVTPEELTEIKIEISVLTPLQKISSPDDLVIGRDGIYVKKSYQTGVLLPQVAVENNWNAYEFVEYCTRYKAGIKNGWQDAELYSFQAIVFSE